MQHRPLADELPAVLPTPALPPRHISSCDPAALKRLKMAFVNEKPGAILVGPGRARSSQVIDSFLTGIDETTCVARLQSPCKSATSYMRALISAIGFEPKDFCIADLDKIFLMFLCHQRTNGRRTVICIEDAQDCDPWVLNNVSELAEMEAEQHYGLFVVVSGRRSFREYLYQQPLEGLTARTGRHISVSPLALAETKEYVLQQICSDDTDDVGDLIKFEAITRMHEIGAGDPDKVSGLCAQSLQMAEQESGFPITPRSVSKAADTLGLTPKVSLVSEDRIERPDNAAADSDRLLVRVGGELLGECKIDSDSFAIGRDLRNDLCIPCLTVSRHHLLVVGFARGIKLVDLGSTNGTVIDGKRVSSHVLKSGDLIKLGECQLEFVAAD